MRRVITVEQLTIGISPDYEGVVVILNPKRPDEMLFSLTAQSAIRASDVLREFATKLSQKSESKKQDRSGLAESHSIVIARERGESLDS